MKSKKVVSLLEYDVFRTRSKFILKRQSRDRASSRHVVWEILKNLEYVYSYWRWTGSAETRLTFWWLDIDSYFLKLPLIMVFNTSPIIANTEMQYPYYKALLTYYNYYFLISRNSNYNANIWIKHNVLCLHSFKCYYLTLNINLKKSVTKIKTETPLLKHLLFGLIFKQNIFYLANRLDEWSKIMSPFTPNCINDGTILYDKSVLKLVYPIHYRKSSLKK